MLLEHFDSQIHDLLKVQQQLDRIGRLFWRLTRHQLVDVATFDDDRLRFELPAPPIKSVASGSYALIQKGMPVPEHCHLYRLSHPLGEYVLATGRWLVTLVRELRFHLSAHKAKMSALEGYVDKSGWLELNQLELDSFQLEASSAELESVEATATQDYLADTSKRQLDASLSRALDENSQYFQRERDKLDAWAADQLLSVEGKLEDTRAKLKETKRQARLASTVEAQKVAQESIKQLERQQRRERQQIFDAEDEIEARRDSLIDALEQQMHRQSSSHQLFRIRWRVV
ncbi:MAG: hypothetical protein ACJAZ7_000189 [Zhongshania aliphaticivorans]|jgi:hypothetical protein